MVTGIDRPSAGRRGRPHEDPAQRGVPGAPMSEVLGAFAPPFHKLFEQTVERSEGKDRESTSLNGEVKQKPSRLSWGRVCYF